MDTELLMACEALASNILDEPDILDKDIQSWQRLFGFTYAESRAALKDWRSDLGRRSISADNWDTIKDAWPDFDKETYEYALSTGRLNTDMPKSLVTINSKAKYLLCLETGLPDLDQIQAIGSLSYRPPLYYGINDEGEPTKFCIVDGHTRVRILEYLSLKASLVQPKFIRHSEAQKNLHSSSRYPTLGIDTTRPQFRLNNHLAQPSPGQDEYPVWYFFYGTLAEPEVLSQLLDIAPSSSPELHVAQVRGGRLTTWGGKYKALVHSPGGMNSPCIHGRAYRVKSQAEEDALRHYETERYAVIRCQIEFLDLPGTGWSCPGLTFFLNSESA